MKILTLFSSSFKNILKGFTLFNYKTAPLKK